MARRAENTVTILGGKPKSQWLRYVPYYDRRRTTDPVIESVHAHYSKAQRVSAFLTFLLAVFMVLSVCGAVKAFAQSNLEVVASKQQDDERRIFGNEERLQRLESRMNDAEQRITSVIYFGFGLAAIGVVIQFLSFLTQRNAANKVIEVVASGDRLLKEAARGDR